MCRFFSRGIQTEKLTVIRKNENIHLVYPYLFIFFEEMKSFTDTVSSSQGCLKYLQIRQ